LEPQAYTVPSGRSTAEKKSPATTAGTVLFTTLEVRTSSVAGSR